MNYIVINKETGKAVGEFFDARNADKIDTNKYTVMTAYDYLVKLNADIKESK